MPREPERLRLVTDFAQLRPGALVVCRKCQHCKTGEHRGILGRPLQTMTAGPGFVLEPQPTPPCGGPDPRVFCITAQPVNAGCVYEVITGIESADEYVATIECDEKLAMVRAHARAQKAQRLR
jgi:hypothetical protein